LEDGTLVGEYKSGGSMDYPFGRIVMYGYNDDICNSVLLIPGVQILPIPLLAFAYAFTLAYLFIGVSIVAETFMAGIEKITSQTTMVDIYDKDGKLIRRRPVLIWNATVANLTLMAMGSSAPEILLAIIETVKNLGKCPGELGASTIVGSAAFNLLCISGLCIYAVNPTDDENNAKKDPNTPYGVKRINDMGVYSISSIASVWAYLWLYWVLRDQQVEVYEAWVTFGSFFVLICICYIADRYRAAQEKKKEDQALIAKSKVQNEVHQFTALEIVRALIKEKLGEKAINQGEKTKLD